MPAIHPGRYLAEILEEYHILQAGFARALGVSAMRISYIIKGQRPVTAEMALLFGRAFDQSPTYWLNLQTVYDLKTTEAEMGERFVTLSSFTPPHYFQTAHYAFTVLWTGSSSLIISTFLGALALVDSITSVLQANVEIEGLHMPFVECCETFSCETICDHAFCGMVATETICDHGASGKGLDSKSSDRASIGTGLD